ncbi:MAG TPA: isocitrate lyase/phosphoenolpyruvate mutase family protein [Pyrinomonadaceae bacterium]|nr:isocitrate lyase/phosphoenolpyruvate mutase family protein [Pyrinomonadaceae bacterium]
MTSNQSSAIEKFRRLHESGCFVLPNPWDRGTARYLAHVGFKALATTSAGFAFSSGVPDRANSLEAMLDHVRDIAEATPLPVNADFQNGYADEPEDVAASVTRCIQCGVAGLSIEDSTGNRQSPLYEERLAVERVRAARQAIDNAKVPVVLTARCEAFLVGDPAPQKVVMKRLVAFADAGADCLYAPGALKLEEIQMIVRAVAPKPINVLVYRPGVTVAQLADLGVRRISVGSALSRVAWAAFARATEEIANEGSFEAFKDLSGSPDLNKIFGR